MRGKGDRTHDPETKEQTSVEQDDTTITRPRFGLDGLVEDAIEPLDEGGWVFKRDAFEKEGLVEE